ncbi:two-component system chemotaxis response regulator CheY [Alteromonadaceae bacterium 2753L.S.0a.02]|nr:two-component system chemotaxis response regulator CheY [Alteromonadaceae bacterium 2753L.S.0a.02]
MAKPLKMLIVDDSNIIRRKIERGHDATKFEVVGSASSGKEAVEKFQSLNPDVVTMDLTMPQMDGIECISRLVALKPEVRILVVSALSDKATGIAALEKGAQGFLCKPFDDQKLSVALNELVG